MSLYTTFILFIFFFFFFNDTATTEIYTLSLHDALPISLKGVAESEDQAIEHQTHVLSAQMLVESVNDERASGRRVRSEEHTSELQSRQYLVCRLLLEKKKKKKKI